MHDGMQYSHTWTPTTPCYNSMGHITSASTINSRAAICRLPRRILLGHQPQTSKHTDALKYIIVQAVVRTAIRRLLSTTGPHGAKSLKSAMCAWEIRVWLSTECNTWCWITTVLKHSPSCRQHHVMPAAINLTISHVTFNVLRKTITIPADTVSIHHRRPFSNHSVPKYLNSGITEKPQNVRLHCTYWPLRGWRQVVVNWLLAVFAVMWRACVDRG